MKGDLTKLDVGYETVELSKVYGPMCFADIRVTASAERECWVIERRAMERGTWVEWVTLPAQSEVDEWGDNGRTTE